jgi:hypothetical protein
MITARFADRPDLGELAAYEVFFLPQGLPQNEVFEFFAWITEEFGVSGGLLRPDDELSKFFDPVETRNPLAGMVNGLRAGDRELALLIELERRHKRRGDGPTGKKTFRTVGDVARAWCGASDSV